MAAVPNYYFNFSICCKNLGNTFTTLAFENSNFSVGNTYYVELPQFSGCVTAISYTTSIDGDVLYNEINYPLTYYASCSSCTGSTSGCFTPTPTPTPIIYYSSDTRCGDNILKRNECDPIVIFPMGVSCVGTNPTLTTISDGVLSLIVTGGTPPYSITWSTGGNGLFLTNLSVGSYSAVVTDFYGDFTAFTTCTLTAPTPVPTETRVTPTPTPLPDGGEFCLTITTGDNFPSTVQYYFYPQEQQVNNRPAYTDGNGHEIIWTLGPPDYWNLLNSPDGTIITNSEIVFPPINGWQVTGPTGNVSGISGQCPTYSNLCLSFSQTKSPGDPIIADQETLYYSGMVDGQPSWQSAGGGYTLSWSISNNRWRVTSVQTLYRQIINTNPASPPISGWVQPGANPEDFVVVSIGNCIPSSTNTGSAPATQNPSTSDCGCYRWRLTNFDRTANSSLISYVNCDTNTVQTARALTYGWTNFIGNTVEICSNTTPTLNIGTATITNIGNCCNSAPVGNGGTSTNEPVDYAQRTASAGQERTAENGNIVLRATSGVPPYQYSIDGGLTYRSIPIFSKLGPGIYNTVIKDASGSTVTERVILRAPSNPTVYQVSLVTNRTTTRNGSVSLISVIDVVPSLPNGVVLTFDLLHTNDFRVSTGQTSASLVNNTILVKNNFNYSANTTVTSTGITTNTSSGCQQKIIYISGKTESWNSITFDNTTLLSLNTTTTVTKNSTDKCYVGQTVDSYIMTNLSISGCTNCRVVNTSV